MIGTTRAFVLMLAMAVSVRASPSGNEDGQPKRYQGQTAAYCACTWLR